MRDAARFFDEAARSMSTPLLALVLADLDRWMSWAREHGDYAATSILSIAIDHAEAEMARREVQPKDSVGP